MVWKETGIKRKVIEEIIFLAKEHGVNKVIRKKINSVSSYKF